jgi:hypothetical protein
MDNAVRMARDRLVERDVRADDPNLSPEANQLLTRELREAVGRDRVQVPREQADHAGTLGARPRRTLRSVAAGNRLLIAITFVALIIVGVIVALSTDSWWAVVAAAGVHALGTIVVLSMTLRLSTEVEHVDPTVAARLEDEGVADPDRALSDLVESYGSGGDVSGGEATVSGGRDEMRTSPDEDPARASAEQKSAMTPSADGSAPTGDRGAPALIPIVAVVGSVVVGLGSAIAVGGIAWLGAAILIAASLAWLALVLHLGHGERRGLRLVPTIVLVVAAVVAGVILVGAIGGYLG